MRKHGLQGQAAERRAAFERTHEAQVEAMQALREAVEFLLDNVFINSVRPWSHAESFSPRRSCSMWQRGSGKKGQMSSAFRSQRASDRLGCMPCAHR